MLVLSRKLGEKIVVGSHVVVTVVDISRDRVKLAFEARGHVPIHREEVFRRIQAEEAEQQKLVRRPGEVESQYFAEFA